MKQELENLTLESPEAVANVETRAVGSSDWLGSSIRGRADWLDLLHECQNGDVTCLFVLKEMERENALIRDALEYYLEHGEAGELTTTKVKEALGYA